MKVKVMMFAMLAVMAVLEPQAGGKQGSVVPTMTMASCRAEKASWRKVAYGPDSQRSLNELTFSELSAMSGKVAVCAQITPIADNDEQTYLHIFMYVNIELTGRLFNYLQRHEESQQFLREDAAGKR